LTNAAMPEGISSPSQHLSLWLNLKYTMIS